MPHTFTNLLAHIIFSTKDRVPHIDVELKPHLFAYMGGIVREQKGKAWIINGTTDHVHLLISLPPAISISEAMRVVKTNSSRWVHDEWPSHKAFGWQTGYGAFSVSQSNLMAVSKYIENQEEHHKKIFFQQELITYLKKHDIAYDERYIWE